MVEMKQRSRGYLKWRRREGASSTGGLSPLAGAILGLVVVMGYVSNFVPDYSHFGHTSPGPFFTHGDTCPAASTSYLTPSSQ